MYTRFTTQCPIDGCTTVLNRRQQKVVDKDTWYSRMTEMEVEVKQQNLNFKDVVANIKEALKQEMRNIQEGRKRVNRLQEALRKLEPPSASTPPHRRKELSLRSMVREIMSEPGKPFRNREVRKLLLEQGYEYNSRQVGNCMFMLVKDGYLEKIEKGIYQRLKQEEEPEFLLKPESKEN